MTELLSCNSELCIEPMTADDVATVASLAHRIWHVHYPAMISQAQIDYMLAQRYSSDRMLEELALPEIAWRLAKRAGQCVGFYSTHHFPEAEELKLDKLYVSVDLHGSGIGCALVEHAVAQGKSLQCRNLILAVNKRNEKAIAAYRRFGFSVRSETSVDIGGGFVMDDFIMARSLTL